MRRMRQGLLPEPHSCGTQNLAYGRVSAQVSGLREKLQSAQQSQDASPDAHGSQALRMHVMRQGVSQKLRSQETRADAFRRRRATRSVGGGDARRGQSRGGLL